MRKRGLIASLEDLSAIATQPSLRVFPRRADGGDLTPETPRVIRLTKMHQFVQQDVIRNVTRHLHEPPVQGDDAARRARAPSRSLIANADTRDFQAMLRGKFQTP